MIKSITLTQNKKPIINFPAPFQIESTFITMGFAHAKVGSDILLMLAVIYTLEDVMAGKKYEVAKYEAAYKIVYETPVTPEEIYPTCQHAVGSLQMFLDFHIKSHKIPQKSIHTPELSFLQYDLQIEADWLNSQ